MAEEIKIKKMVYADKSNRVTIPKDIVCLMNIDNSVELYISLVEENKNLFIKIEKGEK